MDDRWRMLTRVRDLRVQVALNDLSQHRRQQSRAQAALEQAQRRQAQIQERVDQARRLTGDTAHTDFTALQAQVLLDYAAGASLQAREAATAIRRAQLQCTRAQEAVDEAAAKYRREADRQRAVHSQWQTRLRALRHLRLERADQMQAEERFASGGSRGAWLREGEHATVERG